MFNRLIVEKQVIYLVYRWENRKCIDDFEFMCENLRKLSMMLFLCQIFTFCIDIEKMT